MNVGTRIRQRRKELGLRQGELARLVGIGQGTLSDIERGDTKVPSAAVLIKMAEVLKVSQAWVLTGKDGEISVPSPAAQELLSIFDTLTTEQQKAVLSLVSSMKR